MSFHKYKVVVYGDRSVRMRKRSFCPINCKQAPVALYLKTTKKMRISSTVRIMVLLSLFATGVRGQGPMQPYRLPGVYAYEFVSRINHQPYRLTVALPFGYSPSDTTRYP